MNLHKVLLVVDPGLRAKVAKQFDYQARSAGHFVGTQLAKRKIETDFRQLVFGVTDRADLPEIESYRPQSVLVRVPFEQSEYQFACTRGESDLNEYFCKLLNSGFRKTAGLNPRIAELGLASILEFSATGYINSWEFFSKRLPGYGLVRLVCGIDTKKFSLKLFYASAADGNDRELTVLETPPDELHFHHLLGKVTVSEGVLTLTDKHGTLVKRLSLTKEDR
jgi:hypothetical protein